MLSVGENITVDFLLSFETEKYISAFIEILKAAELDFKVSEQIEFRTPGDTICIQAQVVA